MNKITMTLAALMIAWGAYAAESDKPKAPSAADILYDKAVAENTKDAEKAYDGYLKALAVANDKVLKALENEKKNLNDPTKGKLSIQERASAIVALDEKIKALKDGSIGEKIVSGTKGDLLGEVSDPKVMIVGTWQLADGSVKIMFEVGKTCKWVEGGSQIAGTYTINGPLASINFSNGSKGSFNVETKKYTYFNGKVVDILKSNN